MSYIYLIEESMDWSFYANNTLRINGCFTNKKSAIEALKTYLKFHKNDTDIESHKNYIQWTCPDKSWIVRYYRIVKVAVNQYQKPDLLEMVKGKVVVIFPELKN